MRQSVNPSARGCPRRLLLTVTPVPGAGLAITILLPVFAVSAGGMTPRAGTRSSLFPPCERHQVGFTESIRELQIPVPQRADSLLGGLFASLGQCAKECGDVLQSVGSTDLVYDRVLN